MTRNKKLWGVAALASIAMLSGSTFATADSDAPTKAEAQAALKHIDQDQAVIQAYLDSLAAPTTSYPTAVTADADDAKITLHWLPPTDGTPTGYVYGRNGVDNTGYGAFTSSPLPDTARSAVLDKLINGTEYDVFVEAVYATGNKRVTLQATATGTVVSTSPPASPGPSVSPSAPPAGTRPSGLSWSSGVWANQDRADTAAFVAGPRGGKNVDNILVYTARNNMAAQNNPNSWKDDLPANFNGVTQDIVLAYTTWTSDGAFTTQAQAQAIGTSLCSVDATHPIVRVDWEMNLGGGAGDNGAELASGNYAAWVARFRTVATGIKSTCPSALIDFNPNHGADQTNGCNSGAYAAPNNCTRKAFQSLKDVIDIFGIDRYDSWPPVTASNSGWSSHVNGFNELDESRTYAKANGKLWSVPEWGVACNTGGCQWQGNAGGDDPKYVQNYIGYFNANAADMAYETYFNERASYINSDLISSNPNSRAAMKAALG